MSFPWSWTMNPPRPGDPEYPAYLAAQPAEAERLRRLAEAIEPPPLADLDGIADPRDDPLFEVDDRPIEEQIAALSELARYLAEAEAFIARYVAFPSEHEPVAVALWVAHAHLVDRFETSPLLAVTSAEMRSGKTRLLDCLELLVPVPFRVVVPSEAVIYTVLSQRPRPTLLLDEADAIFGPRTAERYEGLRAILNSGNRQGSPVLRVKLEGRRREVEKFDVFGPKAIAAIGALPTTVADRSIPIRMKRRAPGETIAKFRSRTARGEAQAIGPLDPESVGTLGTDGTVPETLNDRAADSWEPLLAIADAAGGQWPARARLAAVALSSDEEAPASTGMRLLEDIRDAFTGVDHLTTTDLLNRLHEMDDAPWGEWFGKPLTARGLAKLLEPYRVLPVKRRLGNGQQRGYFRVDLLDAWTRYAPPSAPVPSVPSVPSAPAPVRAWGQMTPNPTIDCADYREHRDQHRRIDGRWICAECEGGEGASR